MRVVTASRATAVLYHLARSRPAGVCLVPANICPVVPLAFLAAGCQLEMIDIDPHTLCSDWSALLTRVARADLVARADRDTATGSSRVSTLVFVRTYGAMSDAGPLFRQLKQLDPQLCIIDDRCVARPEPNLDQAGMQGADVVLFSTGYAKYVDLGFGGFAFLDDQVAYQEHHRPYQPSALATVTARYKQAIEEDRPIQFADAGDQAGLLYQSNWLDTGPLPCSWSELRDQVLAGREQADRWKHHCNAIYQATIPEAVQLPPQLQSWRFQVRVRDKQHLLQQIFAAGLFASGHYFPASTLFGGEQRCRHARRLYDEIVNLNNDRYVSEQQVTQLAEIVRDYVIA